MGRQQFYNRASGKNMQEAYKKACDAAEDEHGHEQGYSGQINSTQGFKDVTQRFKESKLSSSEFKSLCDEEDKYYDQAFGICLKEPVLNTNKIKTTVTDNVLKGTRIWKMWYVIYSSKKEIGKKELKADAVKIAREYTEKTGNRTFVIVERHSEQNAVVAQIDYKPASNEAPGEYIFFGEARC